MVGTKFRYESNPVKVVVAISKTMAFLEDEGGSPAGRMRLNDEYYWDKCTLISQPYNNLVEEPIKMEVQRWVYRWDGKRPEKPKKGILICNVGAYFYVLDTGMIKHWCHIEEIPVTKTLSELIKEHGDRPVSEKAFLKLLKEGE